MSAPLGRGGLIGLAVGATAGLGLIALIIYRELTRRRARGPPLEARPARRLFDGPDGASLPRETPEDREVEAQQQALAAVEAAVQGLSPEQQRELRNQLDQVLSCVDSLRSEVAELRGGLKDIAVQIIQDVKKGVEDSQRVRRRRHVAPRERTDSTCSSSVYFTASQGAASTFEETSEGGYSTAYAESDYTDRDTDREEGEREAAGEAGQESEEDEDKSCATVLTLRQDDSQDEGEAEEEEDRRPEVGGRGVTEMVMEVPSGELALLLAQSDILHHGNGQLKEEGLQLLLENRAEYGDRREFLWRLARAFSDAYKSTDDRQKRRSLAQQGREEAELALRKNGLSAECHKWFALLSGLSSQHDSTHGKVKSSQVLKEHLDRALALQDGDSTCFYLLGRWCYQVATLDWLEKKTAAALYQTPPNSTLHDALDNFLKAEELSGGSSRTVRLYIAKCHMELGNVSEATNWAELALKMPSDDDEEDADLEAELRLLASRSL